MHIIIKEDHIELVVALSNQIPEFKNPHGITEYQRRLNNIPHLILVAYCENKPIGFKVGYERDGKFYSWMGGILPAFRKLGVAKKLAHHQEAWATKRGYQSVTFKTRNSHKGMLIFALKNGFDIVGFKERETIKTNRILLRKKLIKNIE
ncbi:MAG: GNAT family N-acetyltransferase [Bacteroidetes bacterium]|jgi:predicted GNAT superfamily acetyltransferase|nr:GNAT family N-acetyltransferase [Bacteroidota bacterium]